MSKVSHDSETPAHGQQVITACAFIHHDFDGVTKMLCPRRAMEKKFFPGHWEIPGGHIDFGEDIITGLKRECSEELNVRIKVGDPFSAFTYGNEIKGAHAVQVTYFATLEDSLENIKINLEDHSEYKWVSEAELDELDTISPEEYKNAKKGFALLRGESLNFA